MSEQTSKITLKFDGMEYPLDLADLTARETGVLKRVGHIAGQAEIAAAMSAWDLEAAVALLGIAMQRQGITPDYDKLLDSVTLKNLTAEDPNEVKEEDPTPAEPETVSATPVTPGIPS